MTPIGNRWTNELLNLYEVDEQGRFVYMVAFDADDIEGAVTELADRYAVGEGAAFAEIVRLDNEGALLHARRDWTAYAERYAPDVVMIDHRPVGAGTITDRDEHIRYVRTGAELMNAHYLWRPEIIAITPNAMLRTLRLIGREEAGADVELVSLNICCWRDGLISHLEQFPADQREQARARFDELVASEAAEPPSLENPAMDALRGTLDALVALDWGAYDGLYATDAVWEDRRPLVRSRFVGREAIVEAIKVLGGLGANVYRLVPLATRGDGVALARVTHGSRASAFECEILKLVELDEDGLIRSNVNFDPDDIDYAFDVLDERFIAGEGAPFADVLRAVHEPLRTHRERDWERHRPMYTDDLEVVDHRPAAWGSISGIDAWLAHVAAGIEVMPDLSLRVVTLRAVGAHGVIRQVLGTGTNSEGGQIEMSFYSVVICQDGKIARIENYPLDRLDDARVRFSELRDPPLLESAATRVADRVLAAIRTADRDAFAALHHPDVVMTDRREGMSNQVVGRDEAMANLDAFMAVAGEADVSHEVIAIRGDRLALERQTYTARDSGFELEFLALGEIDAADRLVEIVLFDVRALDDAFDVLEERFIAGEGAPFADNLRMTQRTLRAHRDRDWDTYRTSFAEDIEVIDHRPAGWGEIRGYDAWLDHTKAVIELMEDARLRHVAVHAMGPHGAVRQVSVTGRNAGGGDVELAYLSCNIVRDDRVVHIEVFPLDQLAEALTRFEELRPGPQLAHENAAFRTANRLNEAALRGDWETVASLFADDVTVEDIRPGLGMRIEGRDAAIGATRTIFETEPVAVKELLATRGDRLFMSRDTYTIDDFTVVTMTVTEVDQAHRISAYISFDGDAFDDALADLEERYLNGEGAPYPVFRVAAKAPRNYNARDWTAFEADAAPGFIAVDHRPASWGTIHGGAEFTRTISAFVDVVPNMRMWASRIHAITEHVLALELTVTGTSADGVDLEIVSHVVTVSSGTQSVRTELFPEDGFDDALARFDELAARDDPA